MIKLTRTGQIVVTVVLGLTAIAGFVYVLRGAYLADVINDKMLLDADAWNDPAKALPLLVLGGLVLILAVIALVAMHLGRRIDRITSHGDTRE